MSHGDNEWQLLDRQDMTLVKERSSTYLRAQVYHFTLFSCCMKCDPSCGISSFKHTDNQAVVVHNHTNQHLLLVLLPTVGVSSSAKRHAVEFAVGAGGVEVGGKSERDVETVYVWLRYGEEPTIQQVLPGAKEQRLNLRKVGCVERLIICSTSFERQQPSSTQATSPSQVGPGQMAPATTVSSGEDEFRLVKFYEERMVRGCDGLAIHQCRLDVHPMNSRSVRARGVNLKHVVMVLAGLSEGSVEEKKNEGEMKDADETKKKSANWFKPNFLR
ncbi:unnamed protein product [Ascophyllum nodosum]